LGFFKGESSVGHRCEFILMHFVEGRWSLVVGRWSLAVGKSCITRDRASLLSSRIIGSLPSCARLDSRGRLSPLLFPNDQRLATNDHY